MRMPVDGDSFRALFGAFPTAVSVVTAADEAGRPHGFTCSATAAVSAEPPLLLVCAGKSARTLRALRSTGAFAVNLLGEDGAETSRLFAGSGAHKFASVRWLPSAAAGGAPLLHDVALAQAECVLVCEMEAGDHWILVGRIERVQVHPGRRPLLHQRGTYRVWQALEQQAGAG